MGRLYRKVLLVEDDEEARQELSEALQSWGYVVETAADGIEALEASRRLPLPSVVLLELFLPRMSGWELVAEFQKRDQLSAVPLVVVSGCVADGPSLLPPAHAHFAKPLDLGKLRRVLSRIC